MCVLSSWRRPPGLFALLAGVLVRATSEGFVPEAEPQEQVLPGLTRTPGHLSGEAPDRHGPHKELAPNAYQPAPKPKPDPDGGAGSAAEKLFQREDDKLKRDQEKLKAEEDEDRKTLQRDLDRQAEEQMISDASVAAARKKAVDTAAAERAAKRAKDKEPSTGASPPKPKAALRGGWNMKAYVHPPVSRDDLMSLLEISHGYEPYPQSAISIPHIAQLDRPTLEADAPQLRDTHENVLEWLKNEEKGAAEQEETEKRFFKGIAGKQKANKNNIFDRAYNAQMRLDRDMERAENERYLVEQRAVQNARSVDKYEAFEDRLKAQKDALRQSMKAERQRLLRERAQLGDD